MVIGVVLACWLGLGEACLGQPLQPDLRLSLIDSPDPASLGELLNYDLAVTNAGTAQASGVTVSNTLSPDVAFFAASLSQGTLTQTGSVVVCNLGSLNAGSSATLRITVTPGAIGTITNLAAVSLAQADSNPADNAAAQTTTVVPLTLYPGPTMATARYQHSATLLPDGRVLIAGGLGWSGSMTTAELYDPQLKAFVPTGNLPQPMYWHAATVLQDGTVLLTGGFANEYTAMIYNPTNGTFTSVSNLLYPHSLHTSTLLPDGRVLITGGSSSYSAAELYVPALRGFVSTGSRLTGSTGHRAFLLTNGTVAMLGGAWYNNLAPTNDLYLTTSGTFASLGLADPPQNLAGGAELLDGNILMAGGYVFSSPSTVATIFHPAATNFTTTGAMKYPHMRATATRLPGGRVLIVGTDHSYVIRTAALATPELYSPVAGTFSRTAVLAHSRQDHTATLLQDGTVLIAGGYYWTIYGDSGSLASTEIYDSTRTKPPPAISITNASVVEGDSGTTNLLFPLTLSSPVGLPVSVQFVSGGSNGLATFPPGVTNISIPLTIEGDRNYEPDEGIGIFLQFPSNAVLAVDEATGIILNDDPVPTVNIAPASVIEPNIATTNLVFTAYLSATSYQPITVNFATADGTAVAGADYVATNGVLSFDPGTTNTTFSVRVKGDTLHESDEVFYVALSSPTHAIAGPPGAGTIVNDDGLPGVVDHFTFSPIAPPQYATFPLGLTITARDAANSVVTTFTNGVALSGSPSNAPAYLFDFEEGDFSQWTPLNLGNSPGPYQIVSFDVAGRGHSSLAFRIAANSGAADGITRSVSFQRGMTYALSAEIASMNEHGYYSNGDPGTAHLQINGQEVAAMSFGVFGQIGPGQIFRTNLVGTFLAPSNGLYQFSLRFDRGWAESEVWNYADNVRIMSPSLTPTWLAPFTNGLWSGSVIAATAATNLVLHVDDGDGHSGDSAPFTVLNHADLVLQAAFAPNPARVGSNLVCTLTITNRGPTPATGAMLTNNLPANTTFVSATSTVGSCSLSNNTVLCSLGTLAVAQRATVTIAYRPDLPNTITNTASVSSPDFDPNLANNTVTATVPVNPPLLYIQGPMVREPTGTTTNAVFNVFVGTPFVQTIEVDYATANGSATAGLDYVATSGHLTFTPAITNRTVAVTVLDDLLNEPNETFAVNLSNPVNAALAGGGTANCRIINDDAVPGQLHHFDFSAISSPQQGSVAFSVTVTARDINGALVTTNSGSLTLTAADVLGNPVPIAPSSASMVNGQWTGSVTVPTWEFQGVRLTAMDSGGYLGQSGGFDVNPPTVSLITLSASDLVYSETARLIYASVTNSGVVTPIDPFSATPGAPISITNLSGRLCVSDGGQYVFAALNGATNHICQFDVSSQSVVNAWTLDGLYVEDMCPVAGSPATVAVSRKALGTSPRFRGVAVYDNGVARNIVASGFTGANVIEPSRSPDIIYGYNNETSPAGTQVMKVDATGITVVGGWGGLQGFNVDISCRGGMIFATTGQIYDPTRSIQIASFANTPVADDAPSGRYYLVSAGALTAYDQNTLLPVGVTALPGVTGAAGSFIRWGTNGFALRMNSTKVALLRSPLISGGSSANLHLSVSLPVLPVAAGNVLTHTLTVSNQGPAAAQNVVLAQTLPANSSFISATTSSGSNVLTGGGLASSLLGIPAGGTATVTVNLQTLKPGLLASVASVTSDSLDPNLTNNVLRLEIPVATVPAPDTVTEVVLPTTDLAWDKFSGRIFASAPNANWLLGSSLIALDPLTGRFDPRIPTPLEPAKLAVADDGQYLYVGINSDNSIQRVNLASRVADLKFPTGLNYVADLAVLPGSPQAVAVTAHTTFAVYDNGVMRPNTVGPGPYNFEYYLAVSATNTLAYEGLPNELRRIAIDSSGATLLDSAGLINSFDRAIKFDAGRLYTAGGRVIDPESKVVVTNLPYSGLVCPDSRAGRVFYLTVSGSVGTLHAVNVINFVEVGSVTIPNISGTVSSLIRWGVDGLAFRTTGGQLFLVRTMLADDRDNDSLPDSWELRYFASIDAPGASPADDPDSDGMTNYQEWRAGLNPLVYDAVRFLAGRRLPGGAFELTLLGRPGQSYALFASTNLIDWLPIGNFVCTNLPTVLVDSGATNWGLRFYRFGPQADLARPWLMFGVPPLTGTGVNLVLGGFTGVNYRIERSTNLTDWQVVSNFVSTNALMLVRDPTSPEDSRRFYRALIP